MEEKLNTYTFPSPGKQEKSWEEKQQNIFSELKLPNKRQAR